MAKYFKAKVIDRQLILDRKLLKDSLRFAPEGNYLMILIRVENDRSKSDWQKYYRYLLKEMSEDSGYTPNTMHEFAKSDVLSKLHLTSTTDLDQSTWPIYIERLADWALDTLDFVI